MGRMRARIVYAGIAAIWLVLLAGCSPAPDRPVGQPLQVASQSRPWRAAGIEGRQITTRNYRIYTTTRSRALLGALPGFLEAAWRHYHSLTGLEAQPARRPQAVYLFATRKEWVAMARHVLPDRQAGRIMAIQAGGFYQPDGDGGACIFWNIGGIGALAVASHEGLHQFFHTQMTDQLPMWVEEGFCTLAEGYYVTGQSVVFTPEENQARWSQLRKTILQDRWIDLQDLLTMDAGQAIGHRPGQALGYYAQLWALLRMIRQDAQLRAGLERLIADARAGRFARTLGIDPARLARLPKRSRAYNRLVGDAAFGTYISGDLARFARRYRQFAVELAGLERARSPGRAPAGSFHVANRSAKP